MKRVYDKPAVDVYVLEAENIITVSGKNTLKDGGANGSAQSESYDTLFK